MRTAPRRDSRGTGRGIPLTEAAPAGTGARIALLNTDARAEIEATVRAIHKIETAVEPRFQEHFVNASAIPNAVEPFPILNSLVALPDVTFNTGGGGAGGAEGARGGRRRRRKTS